MAMPEFHFPEPVTFTKKEVFNGTEMETVYREAKRPIDPDSDVGAEGAGMNAMAMGVCPKFNPRTYEAAPGILCEQDVAVKMRDGVTIYVDIFRPKEETNIPALISWSFYGKRPGEGMSEWQIMGVAPGTVSKLAKFESPIRCTGATKGMPSPTSTRAASATPRAMSASSHAGCPRRL